MKQDLIWILKVIAMFTDYSLSTFYTLSAKYSLIPCCRWNWGHINIDNVMHTYCDQCFMTSIAYFSKCRQPVVLHLIQYLLVLDNSMWTITEFHWFEYNVQWGVVDRDTLGLHVYVLAIIRTVVRLQLSVHDILQQHCTFQLYPRKNVMIWNSRLGVYINLYHYMYAHMHGWVIWRQILIQILSISCI